MELLTLEEAAKLCKVGKETLRELAVSRIIRGGKMGRAWRFIPEDLLDDFRKLYNKKKIVDKLTGEKKWQSINHEEVNIGELELLPQMEDAYNEVLGLQTKGRLKNSMTK